MFDDDSHYALKQLFLQSMDRKQVTNMIIIWQNLAHRQQQKNRRRELKSIKLLFAKKWRKCKIQCCSVLPTQVCNASIQIEESTICKWLILYLPKWKWENNQIAHKMTECLTINHTRSIVINTKSYGLRLRT